MTLNRGQKCDWHSQSGAVGASIPIKLRRLHFHTAYKRYKNLQEYKIMQKSKRKVLKVLSFRSINICICSRGSISNSSVALSTLLTTV